MVPSEAMHVVVNCEQVLFACALTSVTTFGVLQPIGEKLTLTLQEGVHGWYLRF